MSEGKFLINLKQTAKGIKETRARGIVSKAQTKYRRKLEDYAETLADRLQAREDLLDLHGKSALSITPGADFDPGKFVAKDLELGFEIHNLTVQLRIARRQYTELFGDSLTPSEFEAGLTADEGDGVDLLPEPVREAMAEVEGTDTE